MSSAYAAQFCSGATSGHKVDRRVRAGGGHAQLSGRCNVVHMHQACRHGSALQALSVARRLRNPLRLSRSVAQSGSTGPHTVTAFQSQTPIEQSQELKPSSSGPKFKPFNPPVYRQCSSVNRKQDKHELTASTLPTLLYDMQTGLRQELFEYSRQLQVAEGSLLIQPLNPSWVYACGSLLTAAFADAMGVVPMYRTFIQHQIRQYLDRHVDMPPKAVVLIALLTPNSASEAESTSSASPSSNSQAEPAEPEASSSSDSSQEVSTSGREKDAILVGTVELSFTQSTRASYLTLNAPADCAYLCNMAVDEEYRRRGYGNILLDAADDVAEIAGQRDIYLHLRFQDVAPASLYKQAGYVSDKQDCFWVRLIGMDRRYLMKKHLSYS